MERKDEAAVERQKLVDDGEAENDDDQTNISNIPPTSAPKSVQTPNSPVLSNRVRIHVSYDIVIFLCSYKQIGLCCTVDKCIGRVNPYYFRYFQVVKRVERKTPAIVL